MLVRILKKLYEKAAKGPFSFYKILEQTIKTDLDKQDVVFLLGYERNGKISIYNRAANVKPWVTKDTHKEKNKIIFFKAVSGLENTAFEYCKHIGQVEEVDMYCYIALSDEFGKIDNTYIQAVCKNYYQWISVYLSQSMKEVNPLRTLPDNEIEREKEVFFRDCADLFYGYMRDIYKIDLKIITNISGTYHESKACCSKMVFLLADIESNEREDAGITFRDPVEIRLENVRAIRKLLQMGKDDMCLWAYWDWEKQIWKVKGLCEQKSIEQPYIMFHMLQHMVWQMDVGRRIAVRYQCGRYLVENEDLNLLTIKKKFQNIFEEKSSLEIEAVFQGAIRQKHGTILVVLDDPGKAEQEIVRLLENSTGIEISPAMLSSVFVQSASAIDGAVIVDKTGKCYGIGMILDGVKIKGNSTYGARHNSALRYIEKCKKEKLKGMVIVVSEDQTIRIYSTEK